METGEMLKWARFVAEKFEGNHTGWVYSRDLGKLKHIRYESDYTGYNHWKKRLRRAVSAWNPRRYFSPKDSLDKMFMDRKPTFKGFFIRAYAWTIVSLRKDSNLPDGQINGIITDWEEDGEYIAFFQPLVGMKVLDFLEAEPDNPYAKAIVSEMHHVAEMSFGKKDEDE